MVTDNDFDALSAANRTASASGFRVSATTTLERVECTPSQSPPQLLRQQETRSFSHDSNSGVSGIDPEQASAESRASSS